MEHELMMNGDSAMAIMAEAAIAFDRYVSNEQGACDQDSWETLWRRARQRADKKIEEQG